MTRHPSRADGQKTRVGFTDQAVGWRWYCDVPGCATATPIVPRNQLSTPKEMRAADWFIAETWGDICPTCLSIGVRPPETSATVGGPL